MALGDERSHACVARSVEIGFDIRVQTPQYRMALIRFKRAFKLVASARSLAIWCTRAMVVDFVHSP